MSMNETKVNETQNCCFLVRLQRDLYQPDLYLCLGLPFLVVAAAAAADADGGAAVVEAVALMAVAALAAAVA